MEGNLVGVEGRCLEPLPEPADSLTEAIEQVDGREHDEDPKAPWARLWRPGILLGQERRLTLRQGSSSALAQRSIPSSLLGSSHDPDRGSRELDLVPETVLDEPQIVVP